MLASLKTRIAGSAAAKTLTRGRKDVFQEWWQAGRNRERRGSVRIGERFEFNALDQVEKGTQQKQKAGPEDPAVLSPLNLGRYGAQVALLQSPILRSAPKL
jgi:hypothetical protein